MATKAISGMWRDPRTGVYQLRKRVPLRFKKVSGRTGDVIKITTGEADAAKAAKAWPSVLAQYAAMEAEWERRLNLVVLTPSDAQVIAAQWAAWIAGDFSRLDRGGEAAGVFAAPGSFEETENHIWDDLTQQSVTDRPTRAAVRLQAHASEAMRLANVEVSTETKVHLMEALRPVVIAAYQQAALIDGGLENAKGARWNPLHVVRARLPDVPDAPAASAVEAAPAVSLRGLFEAWKKVTNAKPQSIREAQYIVEMVIAFMGHDDAARITKADLRRWRQAATEDGRTNNTVNNRLSQLGVILKFGVREDLLPANPTEGLRLEKSRFKARFPFDDADAAMILKAARKEARPSLRWAHWIMAFSGMRVGEVLQLTKGDVRKIDGITVLHINQDHPTKTVKTSERRNVPVHPALVAEGFLEHVATIAGDEPLFPDKGLDKFGKRGGRAWNVTGRWVREVVGIKDEGKVPDHSWRHRLEDCLRAAEVPEDARDAIIGHARKTTGRHYGVGGESLKRLHRELSKVPVPAGVVIRGFNGAAARQTVVRIGPAFKRA